MNPSAETIDLSRFDVRSIPCRVKHGMIFQRWAELPVGAHFVLINDHDPVPLYYQFAAMYPNAFTWEYLVAGPEEFQVKITRLIETVAVPPVAPTFPKKSPADTKASGDALDCRGLEPPEPMVRILNAAEGLSPGNSLRALTDRRPIHLYPELEARGLRFSSEEQKDGSWITSLSRL